MSISSEQADHAHFACSTTRIETTVPLAELIPESSEYEDDSIYVWIHQGEGFIAAGKSASWQSDASTPDRRFSDAQHWWETIVAATSISGDASGLMAFGSFPFSATSAVPSSMVLPEVVVHLHPCNHSCTHPHSQAKPSQSEHVQAEPEPDPHSTTNQIAERYCGWMSVIRTSPSPRTSPSQHPLSPAAQHIYNAILIPHKQPYDRRHQTNITKCSTSPSQAQIEFSSSTAEYKHAFEQIMGAITRGTVNKVVLARRADIRTQTPFDEHAIITHLQRTFPDCWTFSYDHFIGATPEMLVALNNHICESLVLAGTQPSHHSPTLLNSRKDRAEHQYAVDSVVRAMREYGTVYADAEPHVLRLPNVSHLATHVRTHLRSGVKIFSILNALHPTAAVGGTERMPALSMINKVETTDRERFAGPIGWINASGESQWALALRCIQLNSPYQGKMWAGGGIVADSRMEEELKEIDAKLLPLRQTLGG